MPGQVAPEVSEAPKGIHYSTEETSPRTGGVDFRGVR